MKLERIEIRRLPGLDEPLAVEGLSPGLNLILGPNGAGKTSLCRAIRAMLWPREERIDGAEILTWWRDGDGRRRHGELSGAAARWQVEGEPAPGPPPLPEAHLRSCFTLGLPDLLHEGAADKEFAEEIRRQLAGGYDLGAARGTLPAVPKRAPGESRKLREARTRRQECEGASRDLERQESRRAKLEQEVAAAGAAEHDLEVLKDAARLQKAEADLHGERERIQAHPAALENLRGDEAERVADLRDHLGKVEETIRGLEDEIRTARKEAGDCRLSGGPIDRAAIDEHLRRAEDLATLEGNLDGRRQDEAEARASFETAWRELVAAAPGAAGPGGETADLDRVEDICAIAQEWNPPAGRRPPPSTRWILAAVVLFAAGITLALAGSSAWTVLAGLGSASGGLGILLVLLLRGDPRQTGLASSGAAAAGRPADLVRLVTNLRHAARDLRRLAHRVGEMRRLHEEKLRPIREFLASLHPGAVTDATAARRRLQDLRDRSIRVVAALEQEGRAQKALPERRKEREKLRDAIQEVFRAAGLPAGDDRGLQDLLDQLPLWKKLRDDLRSHEGECRRLRRELEGRMLSPPPSPPRDAAAVPGGRGPGILDLSREEVVMRLDLAEGLAARHGDLRQELGRILADIENASASTVLEEALAEEREARDALREKFEEALLARAGQVLLDDVEEAYERESSPALLRRAQELFSRFTRGAFELRVSKASPGDPSRGGVRRSRRGSGFHASDTARGIGRSLEELSDGTRVQLLLAARLAFAAHAERGACLPIVLDEALATSDPERFRAIAGSLLEVVRAEGRQVLYLAARGDEVERWREAAAETGDSIPEVIHLASAAPPGITPPSSGARP